MNLKGLFPTICISFLLVSVLGFTVLVEAEETQGNISFEPNVIPNLTIIEMKNTSFRFEWYHNYFTLNLYIDNKTSLDSFSKTSLCNVEIIKKRETSHVEFGYNITNIHYDISKNVEFLVWKIEGANFDVAEIELENIEVLEEGYNITRFHLPDNLVLSYEDLWLYDFTVEHPNKHETIVKDVKGKSSWNLDPIVFSGGVITITDYDTEGGASNHEEIYTQLNNASQFAKLGEKQYFSNGLIVIGNGTGSTWLVDYDVQVEFNSSVWSANYQYAYSVRANAHLRFGVLIDATEKIGERGVDLYLRKRKAEVGYLLGQGFCWVEAGGSAVVYASHFIGDSDYYGFRIVSSGHLDIYQTLIENVDEDDGLWVMSGSDVDVFDSTFINFHLVAYSASPTINQFRLYQTYAGIRFYFSSGADVENVYARKTSTYMFYTRAITTDHNIINCDLDKWTFYWYQTSTAEVYRQYTFDLTVTYPNGTGIQNANVTVKHYGQGETQDFTELTDSNGQISQKTLSMGFYNQTGGDIIYSLNPYRIEITNVTRYQTYNGNFTLSEETDWTITLLTEIPEEEGRSALGEWEVTVPDLGWHIQNGFRNVVYYVDTHRGETAVICVLVIFGFMALIESGNKKRKRRK